MVFTTLTYIYTLVYSNLSLLKSEWAEHFWRSVFILMKIRSRPSFLIIVEITFYYTILAVVKSVLLILYCAHTSADCRVRVDSTCWRNMIAGQALDARATRNIR